MQEGIPYLRTPALSPDGRSLAFVYANDIWLVNSSGGSAERLTVHPTTNLHPRFSPDGAYLACTSTRTGGGDIYVLPLKENGDIRRLTYNGRYCSVQDWAADGQHLYFTCDREHQGQSIYRVSLTGETPTQLYAEPYETLAHATTSPDGSLLAFNVVRRRWWRSGPDPFSPCDIWLGNIRPAAPQDEAELPRKLLGEGTPENYRGLNRWPLWAPDGAGLYFVSDRDGVENIWYRSLEDGSVRQVTRFREGRLLWPAIARRAGVLVFERDWQIWRLDSDSGEAAPIPIQVRPDTKQTPVYVETRSRGVSELRLSPDGKKVAFTLRGEIFADFADKETDKEQRQGASFRVTNTPAREGQLTWTPDSRSLVYISDRHGENELYRYDFTPHAETRLTDDPAPKWYPRCSPDGKLVAYVRGNDAIYLLNLKTGESYAFARGAFVLSSSLAWSPDSRWLAYISHDEQFFSNVYVQHISETDAHQITFLSNIMGNDLLWSPNGRFLIFTTGQYRSEARIARVDLRPPEPIFRETEFEKLFEDQDKEKDTEKDLDREEAAQKPADETPADDDETPQDKDLDEAAPDEEEEKEQDEPDETPEPAEDAAPEPKKQAAEKKKSSTDRSAVEIVFAGIERRLRFLTPLQMDADAQDISHNSRDLLFRAVVADKVNLWSLPLDEARQDNPPRPLTANSSSKRDACFAPNSKIFYYLEDGQIIIRKLPYGSDPQTLHVRGEINVDFHQEKQQIFGEAWRLLRDTFYDKTFRGQDWHALRERFTPAMYGATTHGELLHILNLLVGEMRASHMGAYWYSGSVGSDGYTGIVFDPTEQAERGLLRVASLVPDSPATLVSEPPRVGEYLLAVNGTPITPQTNLDNLLQRTIRRRVVLRLAASPEGDDAREVAVRPVDGEDYGYLRYRAWVAANKAYVHRVSEGRLGYVHVEEMSYSAYQQFLVDLDAEIYHKEGLVVDIRYNSGGHISTFILDVLTRRNVLISGFRDQAQTNPYHLAGNRALHKPTVLVTNEGSASDAEIFTEIYRRLGLGSVVGKPTAGRVIGTVNWWLLNGSYFRLPIYSYTTPEGEDLEGTGRAVDVDVERPLAEWVAGRDRQLDAAVGVLLDTIAAQQPGPA